MTSTKAFRGIPVSTVSDILVILFISILAIIHLKAVIQPLVIATLLFLLIRPPANWLEQRFGHPLLAYGGHLVSVLWQSNLISEPIGSEWKFKARLPAGEPFTKRS